MPELFLFFFRFSFWYNSRGDLVIVTAHTPENITWYFFPGWQQVGKVITVKKRVGSARAL